MEQPDNRLRRGMSLVETMIAMAVLLIGIVGMLQGTLFASQQNSVAGRLARASSMAAQIRLGLELQGRNKLVAGPLADNAICVPVGSDPNLDALTDGLSTAGPATCIIDVDAFDAAAAQGDKLVGRYDFARDFTPGLFRRVVVYMPNATTDAFAVVVSVSAVSASTEMRRRIFVKQFDALYDSSAATGNATLVDL